MVARESNKSMAKQLNANPSTAPATDSNSRIRRRRRRDVSSSATQVDTPSTTGSRARWSVQNKFSGALSSWGLSPTFRVFLFLGGVIGVMVFFLYNEYVIDQLRHQERNRAALYANLYGLASSHLLPEDFSEQIWSTVIFNREIDFPIIVTDHRDEIMIVKGHGLPAFSDTSAAGTIRLQQILEQMDAANQPVKFFESPKARGLVYFDDRNFVLTDVAGQLIDWEGPDVPDSEDPTQMARDSVLMRLETLRTSTIPDSITIAADGFSQLYVEQDKYLILEASGSVVSWGGSGLPKGRSVSDLEAVQALASELATMIQPHFFRIPTEKYIHYGQSDMIEQISLAPLVTLGVLVMFGLVGYIGFRNIRRSEQRSIWVGMAKETAHQLGTPLSSLSGWLELMTENSGPRSDKDSIVREMQKDMRRLNQIASRFSQIGSVPELGPIDVRPTLSETISYFRGRGPQFGGHTFSLDFGDLPAVALNEELIGWAFENLFKNALDAIDTKNGTIDIRAYCEGDVVKVRVCDNGRGIEADNLTRVFEPGFSTKKRGWGLGLAFVKRIVEEYHGGKIQIVHSAVGEGTTFEIELPVWPDLADSYSPKGE